MCIPYVPCMWQCNLSSYILHCKILYTSITNEVFLTFFLFVYNSALSTSESCMRSACCESWTIQSSVNSVCQWESNLWVLKKKKYNQLLICNIQQAIKLHSRTVILDRLINQNCVNKFRSLLMTLGKVAVMLLQMYIVHIQCLTHIFFYI